MLLEGIAKLYIQIDDKNLLEYFNNWFDTVKHIPYSFEEYLNKVKNNI